MMQVYQVSYEVSEPGGTHKRDLFCVASSIDAVWLEYSEYPLRDEYCSGRLLGINEHVPLDIWLPREKYNEIVEE
jgi:hypothetical protein